MRRRLSILVAAVLAGAAAMAVRAEPVAVTANAIPLDPSSDTHIVGRLTFRGGVVLSSPDRRFGGYSALGISRDGRRMIALSDRGTRLAAHLIHDAGGDLAGIEGADIEAVVGLDGAPLTGDWADAEAISPGAAGEIIVAFERQHRLWRYLPGQPIPQPMAPPTELRVAPSNGGIEALALLDDGRLLAITERFGTADNRVGWVSDVDGWSVLTYAVTGGFQPTGAATLPDGNVVVLERAYRGPGTQAARVVVIDKAGIQPGARLVGDEVAVIRLPFTVDNFEAIEARRGADGSVFIYLMSDDNFSILQRTLLMMFELGR